MAKWLQQGLLPGFKILLAQQEYYLVKAKKKREKITRIFAFQAEIFLTFIATFFSV